MYTVTIRNMTLDPILVYAHTHYVELDSGKEFVYKDSNTAHPMVIGRFQNEVVSPLKVIADYQHETILEVDRSVDIIVREPR